MNPIRIITLSHVRAGIPPSHFDILAKLRSDACAVARYLQDPAKMVGRVPKSVPSGVIATKSPSANCPRLVL